MSKVIANVALATSISLLQACASTGVDDSAADAKIAKGEAEIRGMTENFGGKRVQPIYGEDDSYYLATPKPIKLPEKLPPELTQSIRLVERIPRSLNEISAMITDRSGIRVKIAPDVVDKGAADPATPPIDVNGFVSTVYEQDSSLAGSGKEKIAFSHEGTLAKFLDYVAARYNISWRYDDTGVVFHRYVTKAFQLNIPSEQVTSNSRSGGSDPERSGSQQLQVTSTSNAFQDVSDVIKGLMTEDGLAVFSKSTGSFVITDTPSAIGRIDSYVDELNYTSLRQVAIDVKIYTISITDSNEYNFDLSMIYQDAAKLGWELSPLGDAGAAFTDGVSLGGAYISEGSNWNGTNLTVNALALKDNVLVRNSGTVTTLNNRAKSVESTRTQTYTREVKTSRGVDGDFLETDINIADITYGLNMVFTPRILADDRIQLSYSIDIKEEVGLFTESVNGVAIKQPVYTQKKIMNSIVLKSGVSLILTGVDTETDRHKETGIGESWFKFFGGGDRKEKTREMVVIMLKPHLIGDMANGNFK